MNMEAPVPFPLGERLNDQVCFDRRELSVILRLYGQMVAAGVGVTLLPELSVRPPVSPSDNITLLRFSEPVPSRTIAMCWRRSTAFGEFLPELAEQFRDLPTDLVHPLTGSVPRRDTTRTLSRDETGVDGAS